MRRWLPLMLALSCVALTGCKEKTELRALCAAPKVGEASFETPAIAAGAERLKRAEESEELAVDLGKRRDAAQQKRDSMDADLKKQRAEAEAMSLDDKDARRKAILEVTALEMEAQKITEELSRYHRDVERNQETARGHRNAARAALAPLLQSHGLIGACPVLDGPKAAKP
ncbi:MAG TPA: hypothetical protein VGQ83_06975 [Polyangia bacterium]|jgi:hypothetical protein